MALLWIVSESALRFHRASESGTFRIRLCLYSPFPGRRDGFRVSHQSSSFGWAVGWQTLPRLRSFAIHHRAGGGSHCRLGSAIRDRQRSGRIQHSHRLRFQRIRWSLAGRLLAAGVFVTEVVLTMFLPAHHPGLHGRTGPQGICRNSHWPGTDAGQVDLHPRNQHIGQPGAKHGAALFVGGWAAPILPQNRSIRYGISRKPRPQRRTARHGAGNSERDLHRWLLVSRRSPVLHSE